jgi:hypothetical protein
VARKRARAANPFFPFVREEVAGEVGRMRVYRLAVATTKAAWKEGERRSH